jgi:ubiquinone/menaquinone biosynthesis C-methylase UbiE
MVCISMPTVANPIVETYSRLANRYDDKANLQSCWGRASETALASLRIRDSYKTVLDVGCGTGRALLHLASRSSHEIQFIGVDPATNMCERAACRTANHANIKILPGCFEQIPLEADAVDYLYSIFAFHWVSDVDGSVKEVSRVLKTSGEMDLFFIGRDNGREVIQKTTPIFLKYMGPALLLASARMRKQLRKDAAFELFAKSFPASQLSVEESHDTYYDTLEGHWGWWVRIEGHFIQLPPAKKRQCYQEVRGALLNLAGEHGIPYTIHQLHVKLRRSH